MLTKVKKFVKDHDEALAAIAGAALFGVAFAQYHNKVVDGWKINSGDMYTRDDGKQVFVVTHKNNLQSALQFNDPNQA